MKKKLDFFGAIDRMGDAFIPKTTKTGYKDAFAGIPTVKIENSIFDPHPKTRKRTHNRIMHEGPAYGKTLNTPQLKRLKSEVIGLNYDKDDVYETMHDAKKLSGKYMNKPWSAVPKKYKKGYADLDFDGDGVPNKIDCYPFDYDRQRVFRSSYFRAPTRSSYIRAPTRTVSAPTYTYSSGGVKKNVTSSSPVGIQVLTGWAKAQQGKPSKPITGPFTHVPKGGGGSSGGGGGGGGSSYTAPAPIAIPTQGLYSPTSGKYGPFQDAIYIPKNTGVYDPNTSTYTSPTGQKSNIAAGNVPKGTIVIRNYGMETSSLVGQYGAGNGTIAPTSILEKVQDQEYFDVWLEKYVPGSETMTDYEKYNALYSQVLAGTISDPEFIGKYNTLLKPYITAYGRKVKGAQSALDLRAKKRALLGGNTTILSKKYSARAKNILEARAKRAWDEVSAASTKLENIKIADADEATKKELAKRKGEYTKTINTGRTIVGEKSLISGADLPNYKKQYGSSLKFNKKVDFLNT